VYFDITTEEVKSRVIDSLKFFGGNKDLYSKIKEKPDLYGPFWIMVTWFMILSFSIVLEEKLDVNKFQYNI